MRARTSKLTLMPVLNGFDLCLRLEEESGHALIPVVLVTSLSEPLRSFSARRTVSRAARAEVKLCCLTAVVVG
jgi:CheY-like chemotaxis protein